MIILRCGLYSDEAHFKEVSDMLCLRVSAGATFIGLVFKDDRDFLRRLVKKYGKSLSFVPVVVL